MAVNHEVIDILLEGKNEEQRKVILYFCQDPNEGCGCMTPSIMTDEEYNKMVFEKRDSLNLRKKAIAKVGLDEEEISEIPPVTFEGFTFNNAFAKKQANGNWVSSIYQVAWLFFSSTQIYIYKYSFYMDEDRKQETTDEFFYKDVTSFSTSSETETAHGGAENKKFEVESNKFKMVVPGDKIFVSMSGEGTDDIIQAMKQKLREKKQEN